MKRMNKRLAACIAALALLVCCAVPAFAAEWIDLKRTGSIKVSLYDTETSELVSGGELTLYRVAEVHESNGDLSFSYTNGFENCGVELGDLSESELANDLVAHITDDAESTTMEIGDTGIVEFTDLQLGLYLIVQGASATDYEPINPFLVSVPMMEGETYIYDVDAMPKVGTATHKPPETPTTPENPETPDTPVSPETPEDEDNPNRPNAPGPDNADGWVLGAHGDNDKTNPNAPSPTAPGDKVLGAHLPQTGQLNWPIPVLLAMGGALVAGGVVLKKGSRRNEK